jgi:hypothetical protein
MIISKNFLINLFRYNSLKFLYFLLFFKLIKFYLESYSHHITVNFE